ncbi:hypothetical protein FRC09_017519, partial [Ceratobasidium sp. 395]
MPPSHRTPSHLFVYTVVLDILTPSPTNTFPIDLSPSAVASLLSTYIHLCLPPLPFPAVDVAELLLLGNALIVRRLVPGAATTSSSSTTPPLAGHFSLLVDYSPLADALVPPPAPRLLRRRSSYISTDGKSVVECHNAGAAATSYRPCELQGKALDIDAVVELSSVAGYTPTPSCSLRLATNLGTGRRRNAHADPVSLDTVVMPIRTGKVDSDAVFIINGARVDPDAVVMPDGPLVDSDAVVMPDGPRVYAVVMPASIVEGTRTCSTPSSSSTHAVCFIDPDAVVMPVQVDPHTVVMPVWTAE